MQVRLVRVKLVRGMNLSSASYASHTVPHRLCLDFVRPYCSFPHGCPKEASGSSIRLDTGQQGRGETMSRRTIRSSLTKVHLYTNGH